MRGHTKSLDAKDKLVQTRPHVRNTTASRKRQVVMRKVKSTIPTNCVCGTGAQVSGSDSTIKIVFAPAPAIQNHLGWCSTALAAIDTALAAIDTSRQLPSSWC